MKKILLFVMLAVVCSGCSGMMSTTTRFDPNQLINYEYKNDDVEIKM